MNTKILIASALKPLDDPRGYEKFALSLASNCKYNVHLVGPQSKIPPENAKITFHSTGPMARTGLKRLLLPLKIWRIIIKVKPQLIIVNTHDLLWVVALNRILFGGRVIYDICENYYLNIRHQHNYPWPLKQLLAVYVRCKEYLSSPLISGFILAESSYQQEVKFVRKKAIVVENKYFPIVDSNSRMPLKSHQVKFIYTGTVAKDYGVFAAIKFFECIQQQLPGCRLTIIGHCPNQHTAKELMNISEANKGIHLAISSSPVPHVSILKQMQESDFLLLPYLPNKSTANCMPTKLYEALALKLPVIVAQNPLWSNVVTSEGAGITVDFLSPNLDFESIASVLNREQFYNKTGQIDPFWRFEEPKLLNFVQEVLNN